MEKNMLNYLKYLFFCHSISLVNLQILFPNHLLAVKKIKFNVLYSFFHKTIFEPIFETSVNHIKNGF
jgi:hypothetical protein